MKRFIESVNERIRQFRLILGGILCALLYWWLDLALLRQARITDLQGFTYYAFLVRLLVVTGILGFSLFAQFMINRYRGQRQAISATYSVVEQILDTAADGIRVIDRDYTILQCNKTFIEMVGLPASAVVGRKCYEVFNGPTCHTPGCPLVRIMIDGKRLTYEAIKKNNAGREIFCQITAAPFLDPEGRLLGIVESFRDVGARREWDQERDELIGDLVKALREVKTLSGMLPICAWCKKIRDDRGYWSQIESYITSRSGAQFSHSICPECRQKEFPDYEEKNDDR